jgi:hypothetical protein
LERAETTSVHFRGLKTEKLGDELHMRTSGIKNFEFSPALIDTRHSVSHWENRKRQLRHNDHLRSSHSQAKYNEFLTWLFTDFCRRFRFSVPELKLMTARVRTPDFNFHMNTALHVQDNKIQYYRFMIKLN